MGRLRVSVEVTTWQGDPVPSVEVPGARINYQKAGRGPAVLLLQGCGVAGEGWRPQMEGLSDRYTCVAIDNRGIGASTAEAGRLTLERMAADALAVMDAEAIDRFHIVGHSMGGLLAQQLALDARARVTSLALLCTFARGKQGAQLTPALLLTALRMRIGTRAMRRHAFLQLVMPEAILRARGPAQLAEELRALFGHDLAEQPPIVMKQVGAMARHDVSARLAELGGIATLVVSAAEDRIARPAFGQQLAAAIPGARFVELAAAGHGVAIQCADMVNALLADHFDRAEAAA
jgi:aminoacrylate hydrolase